MMKQGQLIRIIHTDAPPVTEPRHCHKTNDTRSCMGCTALHISEAEMAFCIHNRGPIFDEVEQASDYVCDVYNAIL
jgi:hypothetical protein